MTEETELNSIRLTANVKASGCAAKISAADLNHIVRNLSRLETDKLLSSLDNFEDAAVYKISDNLALVQSVDFFPPVVDDPYMYGRIAACNALSDIYAMGGTPALALNIFSFPTCDYPLAVAEKILHGGAETVAQAGAILAGGHSIQAPEPVYGLSVTGFVDPKVMFTNCGAREDDRLILCKKLGTGIALLGLKGNTLSASATETLLDSLTTLNDRSLSILKKYAIHALTDVTGFGLTGHLHEMARASNLSARIYEDALPVLPEVMSLAAMGLVPAGAYSNRECYSGHVSFENDIDTAVEDLLFDPQTSGGLLASIKPEDLEPALKELSGAGIAAAEIGIMKKGKAGKVEVVKHG